MRAATFDPAALAAHYDLADLLVARAIHGLPSDVPQAPNPTTSIETVWEEIVEAGGDVALREAYRRVAGQLLPFAKAASEVLGDAPGSLARIADALKRSDRRGLLSTARVHHKRRRRAAPRILAASIGLGEAR
jgi:hypothetical protein